MRLVVRNIITGLLIAGILYLPANGASQKPVGLVIQAQLAHLDSAEAAIGTTVYSGDTFDTQDGGTLRLRFGSSQIYLLSASAATIAPNAKGTHVAVIRGSVGMASNNADPIQMETPLGTVRATNGESVYGLVRITGPEEMIVSAYKGNLVIDRDGEDYTVEAGKSYDVTLEADPAPTSSGNGSLIPVKRKHLALKIIIVAAEGITAYILWREWSESCHDFKGC
jgi:hypothetical protein